MFGKFPESCKDGMARLKPEWLRYAVLTALKNTYMLDNQHLRTRLAYTILTGLTSKAMQRMLL